MTAQCALACCTLSACSSGNTVKLVAIDFETADYGADSACALGIAVIENTKVTRKDYRLIRPPRRDFVFSYIHGITWTDVAREAAFANSMGRLPRLLGGGGLFRRAQRVIRPAGSDGLLDGRPARASHPAVHLHSQSRPFPLELSARQSCTCLHATGNLAEASRRGVGCLGLRLDRPPRDEGGLSHSHGGRRSPAALAARRRNALRESALLPSANQAPLDSLAAHILIWHNIHIMARGPSFEWDAAKDRFNRVKHGVSFALAQYAFFDPRRVVAEDLSHRARSAKVVTGFASDRALKL